MIVSTPYRWMWRTAWKNISHWFYDIRNGLSNLWRFRSAVWWYRSWDYTGLLGLIETAADDMHETHRDHSLHVGAEKTAKQLLMIRELCKRLREDDYFTNAGYDPETWKQRGDFECQQIAKHSAYMAKQDAAYLGKIFKFIQHWWS